VTIDDVKVLIKKIKKKKKIKFKSGNYLTASQFVVLFVPIVVPRSMPPI
jgi:hypothetical protein